MLHSLLEINIQTANHGRKYIFTVFVHQTSYIGLHEAASLELLKSTTAGESEKKKLNQAQCWLARNLTTLKYL